MTDRIADCARAPEDASADAKRREGRRRIVATLKWTVAALFSIVAGGLLFWKAYDYVVEERFYVSTDDAYVRADISTLAAKVSGYVATVDVAENQHVSANELIATIDPADYRLAVEAARRKIGTQDTAIDRMDRQIEGQASLVSQAIAQLSAAEAESGRAAAEYRRVEQLLRRGFTTRQRFEQAQADQTRALANVASARAAIAHARTNDRILRAQQAEARAVRDELAVALAKSEQDLATTNIRAPFDGIIAARAVQVGQFVQPGTRLVAVVSTDNAYVEANFKETQLHGVRLGQRARISVDALPDAPITGRVESISPATGSQFSLLPPENATGNFTKITQRVPVRIAVSPGAAADLLRPGMSVRVDVDTRSHDADGPFKATGAARRWAGAPR